MSSANWSVANSSSPAGYIYPSLWLQENFDHNITDLHHAVQSDSYGSAFARLASGQVDVLCTYADARRDYEDEWTGEYAMTNSIWEDTAVVGVTPAIYNDTISVSKTSPIMDDAFRQALGQAFINIGCAFCGIFRKSQGCAPPAATPASRTTGRRKPCSACFMPGRKRA